MNKTSVSVQPLGAQGVTPEEGAVPHLGARPQTRNCPRSKGKGQAPSKHPGKSGQPEADREPLPSQGVRESLYLHIPIWRIEGSFSSLTPKMPEGMAL